MKTRFRKIILKPESSVFVIMIIMLALTARLQTNFFEPRSIVSNINAFAPVILLAMGQAVVLIAGGLDLSSGNSMSLLLVILTRVMVRDQPITGLYALLIALAAMFAMGLINGLCIGYLRLPSIIATFATSYIWLGVALFIRPTPGGQCVNWMRMFYTFNEVEGMPDFIKSIGTLLPPAFWLIIIGSALWFIVSRTRTGRHIYAVGSNRDNAYASGINTSITYIKAYMINAFFIFLCALYFAAQNQSGDARLGNPLTLRAIAAAAVGGIALSGGRGSVYFAICGALILNLVNKIIFFANISSAYQTLVSGLIVLFAISISFVYNVITERTALKGEREA